MLSMLSSFQWSGHTCHTSLLAKASVCTEAQHTPRQLKGKSLIKHYRLVAFCILWSADSLIICALQENGFTLS